MTERFEIRVCGDGGQGVVLASFIMGQAASVFGHKSAILIQDYGPEARGGTLKVDVAISDERVLYPKIYNPSVTIVMSQAAYDKLCDGNYKDTLLISNEHLVKIDASHWKKTLAIPATRMAKELGRVSVANVVMLGFFTAVTGIISRDEMQQSVQKSVPKGTAEFNMQAFGCGYAYALDKPEPARNKVK